MVSGAVVGGWLVAFRRAELDALGGQQSSDRAAAAPEAASDGLLSEA
jgi:hypothetical protein